MTKLESALSLAKRGFHVFPVKQETKDEPLVYFKSQATTDEAQIKRWWIDPVLGIEKGHNIGIYTGSFNGGDGALCVVDIDQKEGKNGQATILGLELEGFEFNPTLSVKTPSGGTHLYYRVPKPTAQRPLGPDVDIRSAGGYVLAPGSTLQGRTYEFSSECDGGEPEPCPQKIVDRCGEVRSRDLQLLPENLDEIRAETRARFYLTHEAPFAIEGAQGDQTTFVVAARLRDLGLSEPQALDLLIEEGGWNERSSPPWDFQELELKVRNAYTYAKNAPGADAPESDFKIIEPEKDEKIDIKLHPFDELNKEYAFVTTGGGFHIIHETTDAKGRPLIDHMQDKAFHARHAAHKMKVKDKERPVTKLWMESKKRRSYRGICFTPGMEVPNDWYNLWRGFSVKPADPLKEGEVLHESVQAFLEHALKNVCGGDKELCRWLIGYFAHLVQKPYEQPLTALVFKGKKGTGKSALVDRIGALMRDNYRAVSNKRYLVGNFNSHLENCLVLKLEEAFWSGDKQADGILKELVTGETHMIERKNQEPYPIQNIIRTIIIGNEDWLIPATEDERRYAVFQLGEERKQDWKFFNDMRIGMENGGYAHLLRYLLDFDLTGIQVKVAPETEALLAQKEATLDVFSEWWLSSLKEGSLLECSEFGDVWPEKINKTEFRESFYRYARNRNVRGRLPDSRILGKLFRDIAPSIRSKQFRAGFDRLRAYTFSTLEEARRDWEKFIGHKVKWDEDADE